jgi:hypothetical protein
MPMWPGTSSRENGRTGLTGSFSRWENLMTAPQGRTAPARPALSARNKAGLILAILLGLGELANIGRGLAVEQAPGGPPKAVLMLGAALGPVLVIAAIYMWVSRNRLGGRIVAGALTVSIIPALPAFFARDVPALAVVVVAVLVVVAIVAVMLVLASPKPAV